MALHTDLHDMKKTFASYPVKRLKCVLTFWDTLYMREENDQGWYLAG